MTIREARARAGLTQLQLCASAGLSIKTLAAAERWGTTAVSMGSLQKIAAALSLPIEKFISSEGECLNRCPRCGLDLDSGAATLAYGPGEKEKE